MLDERRSSTLIERVMAVVRQRIEARALRPGARLPSIRQLAREEAVSPSTVVEAYERLVAQGAIEPRPGSGFYVTGQIHSAVPAGGPALRVDRAIDPLWIMRQSLELDGAALMPGCGWLPESWMPVDAVRRGLRSAARAEDAALAAYGTPLGHPALRGQLSRRLRESGIEAAPQQVLLTDSATQALDLICRILVESGDTILVDDPCYFNFLGLAHAHRTRIVGIPMTPSGPDLAAFAAALEAHKPRLYCTIAALHNPTGATLSPATAHRLLGLAAAHGLTIVEDTIFADLEPDPPAPRLAGLDGLDRVLLVGSFSKTVSASLRCGFIAGRPDWIERLTDLKLTTAFGSHHLSAHLVHGLLMDGTYRRHTERLRDKLARAMSPAARQLEQMGLKLWTEPRGGLFLWAELPEGLSSADLARQAVADGLVLAPGNVFSANRTADRFLRFNVAQCGSSRVFEVLRPLIDGAPRRPPQAPHIPAGTPDAA